ncbi:MAG: BatD family protein [Steroidobacteraceae bacterium]
MTRRLVAVLLAALLCSALPRAYASVTAALSNTQIATGTTVQLTLTYDGLTTSEPQLAPLRRNFDILSSSSSTSVQFGTGGSAERSQVILTLAPKRTGQLTIPPLAWDGEHSAPLRLTVSGSGAVGSPGTGATAPIFIVSRTRPAAPYVQAQIHLTVQIYTDEQLYHASLAFSGDRAVLVKHIGADQYGTVVRNGRVYRVITRRFVLFGLHSGRISLAGPVLEAEVATHAHTSPWPSSAFGGFFGGLMQTLHPVEVHGDPIVLSVRPRPPGVRGRDWLPAQSVTLSAHWSPRTDRVPAGDPLTLELDLKATGLTAAQLPNLVRRLRPPAEVSRYPDQAQLQNAPAGNGILGSRRQTIAFIADRPGHYVLPALTVHWWNTRANRLERVTLPAQTLDFTPAVAGSAAARPPPAVAASAPPAPASAPARAPKPPATGSRRVSRWQWLTGALALLWVATLAAWLWSRRRRERPAPPPPELRKTRPDAATERTAFHAACARNDALAARRHLLGWISGAWKVPSTSLHPLFAAGLEPHVQTLLQDLERACYGGGSWAGLALAQALRDLPARRNGGRAERDTLPPLYP